MSRVSQVRFSQFNASLNRSNEGELINDLSTPDNTQAQNIAEIIQRNNPDVLLINEFDFDADGTAAQLFQENYLGVSQNGVDPVEYPYFYIAPSNTGIPSGFDLNNDGEVGGPNDAYGFGFFPGQFGMVVYSKHPIDTENIRTFQNFLWQDMPGALLPDDPTTPEANDWYSPEELEAFRLSSKSHWDIPIEVNGETVHVLASHPTPPVFDGPEDRNGRRNHDEIRFWSDYVTPGEGDYIYDDAGNMGGLAAGSRFVVMGDQNADPFDGDSTQDAILQLLDNPLFNTSVIPSSEGGPDAAQRQGGINDTHQGNPAFDTADFADTSPGNLRADYVLPSQNLEITEAAVFWPTDEDPLFPLVGEFPFPSSDHRLVWADVVVNTPPDDRSRVSGVDFLGEVTFPTGFEFAGTEVGGLSGIAYDAANQTYYGIADDRSQNAPARFYRLDIDLSDGSLDEGDISFQAVTTLLDENGQPFPEFSLDPEGIALTDEGTFFISSEGDANRLIDPFVNEFSLTGEQLESLPVPNKFLPTEDGSSGIRNNLAFESLTLSPNQRFLYTATENALIQDGPSASLEEESPSRILRYDLSTGEAGKEFFYFTEPVPDTPIPADGFSTNGLVELLALDNTGSLLALERSFSAGVGNSIKLFEVGLQNTTDLQDFNAVADFEIDAVANKRLLLDFADLGITLDNVEGMAFGPTLANGQQSLVLVSDNNFNDTQFTQFLTLGLDLETIPAVAPTVETPDLDRIESGADADDPAIYVNAGNAEQSLVITTLKDGGLAVYNLEGQELQTISSEQPGDIRYNNVDLVYNFNLGGQNVDLAIASDRENDTLSIFQINPETGLLTDVTASNLSAPETSIFGIDDGEITAYGLATYTSPVSGETYAFVSQADGDQIAQLELFDNGNGQVSATTVRTLTVPIPAGGELDDAQVEGLVVDRERGILYAGQEETGIFKFSAEPGSSNTGELIEAVRPEGSNLEADVEGLTIYYGNDGTGYLLASSQGDSTYAVFSREGNNEYLGSFAIGESGGIDGAEESDGADIINVPLGSQFPSGLLVVQDGSNNPAFVAVDDEGELQNFNTNFKFIPWENVAHAFPEPLQIDTTSFDPRNPEAILPSQAITGSAEDDNLFGDNQDDIIFGLAGDDNLFGSEGVNQINGGAGNDTIYGGSQTDTINGGAGNDTIYASEGDNTIFAGSGDDIIYSGAGADTIVGSAGDDTIWLGGGMDIVVLAPGSGIDTINNFQANQTKLGLSGSLGFESLNITQAENATLISAGGELLASLSFVQASNVTSDVFIAA